MSERQSQSQSQSQSETFNYWLNLYERAQNSEISTTPSDILAWASKDGINPGLIEDAYYDV